MQALRRGASVVELLAGAWAVAGWLFGQAYQCTASSLCTAVSLVPEPVPLLGGILVACAIVSLAGFRFAFALGATISAAVAAVLSLFAVESGTTQSVPLALLSAVAMAVSIFAYRSRGTLPEQANPMNLPVFG